jgi:hypothetical protein
MASWPIMFKRWTDFLLGKLEYTPWLSNNHDYEGVRRNSPRACANINVSRVRVTSQSLCLSFKR